MNAVISNKRLPVWLLGAAMLISIPLIIHWQRGIGITRDEWQFLLHRDSFAPSLIITEFNGHFMPFTTILLKLEQSILGEPARWPLALLSIAAHLSVVAASFIYMRLRVGEWWAAAGALLILFFGTGYELIVWPFNSGWLLAIAAGIAAVIVFERPDSTQNRVIAALFLALAFAGNNIGAVFAVTIAVGLLFKDSRRKAFFVIAVPFGLFVLWWLLKASHDSGIDVKALPGWTATMIEGTGAGLLGNLGGPAGINPWGAPIALLAIVAIAAGVSRRGEINLSLAIGLAMPFAFIVLIVIGRGGRFDPIASRYSYTLFVLVLLALAEVYRGRRLDNPGTFVIVAGLVVFCLAGNLVVMAQGADGLRQGAQMDKEYATATLHVGKDVADKVSSNDGDTLFVPGDTPDLYEWISDPKHQKYAYSPAELAAAAPDIRAHVVAIEKLLRAEAARNR